jgi:hypothetical protein
MWNITPSLLLKGKSVESYFPHGDIDGLHLQIECMEGTAAQLGLSYDIYTIPILKTDKGFIFPDEIGDKTLLQDEVGEYFVEEIEKEFSKHAIRLLLIYQDIEEWIKTPS